jgi:cell wall-associated NlpC family hydrolase
LEPPSRPAVLESEIVRNALDLRGVPYRSGGDSPAAGFDCSGFVHYVFAQQNIDVPRTVAAQFAIGYPAALSDVREGDLVFFTTIAPGPSHVGLALGRGEFIHAPSSSGTVRVERLDSQYWHDRVVAVKRIF